MGTRVLTITQEVLLSLCRGDDPAVADALPADAFFSWAGLDKTGDLRLYLVSAEFPASDGSRPSEEWPMIRRPEATA